MKYVVVTGGVVSGLGKGVTISSAGRMLQAQGLTVTSIKIDPYLNVDAGTMSPFEHGEVFVLGDGGEADLDLGNYERFLNIQLTSDHNITTGKIYRKVIAKERKGDYLGKTVQVVPHITNEIQDWIERVAHIPIQRADEQETSDTVADVCLIEVGGTVGDIESMVFLEALRQFQFRVGKENFCLMFVSLVPVLGSVGEQKTKPTQHGVKELRSLGLSPQVILCRSTLELETDVKAKISGFCHVPATHVLSVHDVQNIYHVPLLLCQQKLHLILVQELRLKSQTAPLQLEYPDFDEWRRMAHAVDNYTSTLKIALIGKYNGLQDSYLSVIKSLKHATMACDIDLEIIWVDSTHLHHEDECVQDRIHDQAASHVVTDQLTQRAWDQIKSADGVIIPGGFGNRGFNGKVKAAEYCRVNGKPCLGICLGFQAMVVEYCRSVMGWKDAHSSEFVPTTPKPVVMFMPEIDAEHMGGTMRLGSRATKMAPSTLHLLYGKDIVWERHRHRYEVNPQYVDEIHDAGLQFVGRDAETGSRMEVSELPSHPYYVGCQYHPEFQSRPLHASPPFLGLIMASCDHAKKGGCTTKLKDYLARAAKKTPA